MGRAGGVSSNQGLAGATEVQTLIREVDVLAIGNRRTRRATAAARRGAGRRVWRH